MGLGFQQTDRHTGGGGATTNVDTVARAEIRAITAQTGDVISEGTETIAGGITYVADGGDRTVPADLSPAGMAAAGFVRAVDTANASAAVVVDKASIPALTSGTPVTVTTTRVQDLASVTVLSSAGLDITSTLAVEITSSTQARILSNVDLSNIQVNLIGSSAAPAPDPDTNAPVITSPTWNDVIDTATFGINEAATLEWAIYLAADGVPVFDPSTETWTGITRETGTDTVTPPSHVLTLTPETVVGDRLTYAVVDGAGNSNAISGLVITLTPPPIEFSVQDIGGEPVIEAESGPLSVTMELGPYAGTHDESLTNGASLTVEMVEAAVTPHVLPVVTGGTAAGDTLTAAPGFWLYANADLGDPTHQWYRDGVAILDATGASYTLAAGDLGADVTVRETFDGVTIESPAVSIPASNFAPSDLSLADDFDATVGVVDVSGEVNAWVNQGTVDTTLTMAVNNRFPLTGVSEQNQLNTLAFDGDDALFDAGAPFSPSGTVFVVANVENVDNASDAIYAMDNGTAADFQIDSGNITGGEYHGRVNSSAHTNLERSTPLTGWFVLAYRWDSSNNTVSLWVNGVKDDEQADYTTHYASTASRVVAFSNRGVTQEAQGYLAQIWRFTDALSDADMANMFNYAQTRWGIS